MRKVGIPRSLPYFFGSLKVAITLAFVGAVISESVASNDGIGNLMLQAQAQFQVPLIFAGLLALAVEGIVMYCADGDAGSAHDRLGAALGLRAGLKSVKRRPVSRRMLPDRSSRRAARVAQPAGLGDRRQIASASSSSSGAVDGLRADRCRR